MSPFSLRSLLLAAIVISNCISWTASRHHHSHNLAGHKARHRRQQGAGLYLSASYVIPGGEGEGWGDWGDVSPCSRTCGGGVASQKRICLQFGPDGQPQCTGGDTKYFSCETQDCPAGSKDFREQQCSEFDDVAFRDIKYKWVPYTQAPNPCELNCMPHGERFYYRHRTKVVDGTRCNDESFDVCVNGTCQPVGCDMMLGSNAREDKCRECRGTGAYCHTTVGLLDTTDLRKGYNDVLLIPEGATSIVIAERRPSNNYLALRAKNGTYYLNGEYHIDFPRSLTIAGALWYYERSQQGFAAPDKLRCLGPTNEPLYLALLLQDENVGIDYEYSVPNDQAPPRNKKYNWVHDEFTTCSAPCGGGFQTRNVTCRSREELELVDEVLCDSQIKPPTNQSCNTDKCAAQWTPQPWGECSKRCGQGGIRSREVQCTQIISNGSPSIVADKTCFDLLGPKPALFEECNENATCPVWFTGRWRPCDKLCDEGKQTRQVVCYQKNEGRIEVLKDSDCEDEKPVEEQSCMLQPCDGVDWVISEWSGCDTCLSTLRSRTVVCATKNRKVVNETFCSYHETPVTEEPCDKTKLPPCDVQWYATQWSKCSVDCGKGVQTRKVFCGLFDGASVLRVDDSRCAGQPKYNDTKVCEIPKEKCPSKWFAGPWTACTKECNGGEQFRRVMCIRGGEPATDCDGDVVLSTVQDCNTGPCNEDELMPTAGSPDSLFVEDEDCVMEEELYEEVGIEEDSMSTIDGMFSDSPTDGSGSGMFTLSTAEHESTFDTESTLSLDELLSSLSSSTGFDIEGSGASSSEPSLTDSTGSTAEPDTGATSNDTDSTDITGSSASSPTLSTTSDLTHSSGTDDTSATSDVSKIATTVNLSQLNSNNKKIEKLNQITTEEKTNSGESYFDSSEEEDDDDDDDDDYSFYNSESDYDESSSSEESAATDVSSTEKVSSGSGPTDGSTVSGLTSEGASTEAGSTEPTSSGASDLASETETGTTESGASSEYSTETPVTTDITNTETTDTSETIIDATEITETTETGSTETSDTTEAESTTNEASTTESATETTETSDTGSTESTDSTVAGSTEVTSESGATETSESGGTETTESGATETTESGGTETTESGGTETTESGGTETTESGGTETTESGGTETTESGSTETTESGGTETTESGGTETTESGGTETTESGSTETTVSGSTETTESGGTETTESGRTDTTESGSTETTESGTETTESEGTETTESGGTETTESGATETTESGATETTGSGGTETTESAGTETTESGATESTETTEAYTGSTESTVSGETEATEGTESEPTTEAAIGTTLWDLTSAVLTTKKPAVCKPRSCKRSKFGCCPDNKTAALGPFDEGCRKPHTCMESTHGCCPDGLSPAQGPANKGCPDEHCEETLFGCCESDGKTPAEGNEQEGCPPPPPPCVKSKYGCCKDETEAKGPEKQGCPETSTTVIIVTETEGAESTTAPSEGSTGAAESCAESEFGCCFDNQTAATGAGQQGCPCEATEFGCCPDGAPAQGPNYQGCVKSCNTSAFGCCADGKTPAHGPNYEGCCLLTAYGCCPDNYKPADGPHLEGCGCQHSQFGCCPDNVTVATCPSNRGCGCQYADYGCCPDRHTEATGPNFEGCKCHTYQFGCCPDGETIAAGPNGQGCYCQHSAHGCCGDEQTHAKGPNRQGCDCATSKYGCCIDGVTEAPGPKFEGCADKPEDRQAMCGLKFERGPCRNYSVGWYYDTEYGGCSRFWYGGCEGNGNRFASKEECEATCVSPPAEDACRLPQIKGACLGYNVRWYFDTQRETCSSFVYGGCLGNNNNFESLEKCRVQCEPERATDQCSLSIERGRCAGAFPRWGYNVETRRCDQFLWGGCEGNTNRFSTEAACMLRCNPPGKPQPECSEPQNVGNCMDTEARWSFSQTENRCVPFYHTGCGGNGNTYIAKEECEDACPSAFVPELCTLPASTGDCSEYTEKWYFDTKDQRCRQFYYGGCGGNGNRFNSEQECASRCTTLTTTPAPALTMPPPHSDDDAMPDFCFLGIDPGPCNQVEAKWGYDYTRGKCVPFQFGGCGGNQNNFRSEDDCNYYCRPAQDICQLPMLSGPCNESIMSWFYDAASDSCSQFAYGGCDGNDNRFASREECESRCKTGPAPATAATTTTVDPRISESIPPECLVPSTLEACRAAGEVWYYEPAAGACAAHENHNTGDDCRNTGVFYSQEACERSCGAFRNIDVCRTPMEAGPCTNYAPKYHYNATSRRCEEFAYGGCLGGPNRFSTHQECEQVCMITIDPCTLEPEPGNCLGNTHMWFYHPNGQCYQFSYTGCGGNDNKFDSREACEARCKSPAPAHTTAAPVHTTRQYQPAPSEECRTPDSVEPCSSEYVFYFDEVKGECAPAAIGGCTASNNVYRTEEECERRCGAFRGLDVCRAPLDPGPCRAAFPKVYFDAASGSCKEYTYGGCQGGPNRFSTTEECEEVCAGQGPAAVCLAPTSSGERCGEAGGRRWHYDVARADCIVFSYQGCGGTENNFRSYEECAYLCRVETSLAPEPEPDICERYAEECAGLETSCEFGVRRGVAAEGCERCACEQPDCEPRRRECDALACTYGVQRFAGPDGCEACQCYEDPCVRMNCTSEEKCVATAYRDPATQEILYSAHCVTNEISDCEAYIEECSRLQCTWGVQRTRVGGCERCSCVPEEVDCSKLQDECRLLQCTYGMNTTTGNDGCTRCKCNNEPCANKLCPEGERCVAKPYPDPVTQEWRYSADCRIVNKAGVCPARLDVRTSASTECRQECRDDADCRGVLKCCARGCTTLCAPPEQPPTALPSTTHMPDIPQAPQVAASSESKPEVEATEGGKALLRCLFHGNPPPKITWRFGEITIDGDEGRYRLLSDGALEIVSLFRNDTGVYICVGTNDHGTAEQNVTLTVADPVRLAAGIAGAETGVVTGELGRKLVVHCRAYGYPSPTIYWYRANGGPMVPFSSPVYEARGNDLTIKRLALDTLGEYECQAYNGEGKAATWRVAVHAYRPRGEYSASPYLVAREPEVLVTPPQLFTSPPYAPPPTTTRQPEFDLPQQFTVPVHTSLTPASTSISAGSQLDLPCEVEGFPEPDVYWTKDDVRLHSSDRLWLSNSRLTLTGAQVSDSGVYTCHAANAYSSHSSYVQITVQELSIPASCVDNPTFANCALIVQSRFCVHKYYSKFCCESCVKAGQLDPRDALMQSDQPFWRRK